MAHASSSPSGSRRSWYIGAAVAAALFALFGASVQLRGAQQEAAAPAPSSSATNSPTPTVTPSLTPTPSRSRSASPTATPTRTTRSSPTDAPNDEGSVDDNLARYPGSPLSRNDSAAPTDLVRVVQQRLTDAGFAVAVDGIYAASTERAVRRFQSQQKLPVTGVIDESTWNVLFLANG